MMLRLKNSMFLLSYAWKKCRSLFFTTAAKSIFNASLPLINIAGLGLVVNALMNGEAKANVVKLIILFVSFNLLIAITTNVITLLDNNIMRRASDIIQLDYARDGIDINYHYVQDGSILDLKKKSMGAHPVWFIEDLGTLLLYIVQFTGIAYIFAVLSPIFIVIILITSTLSVFLSFKTQRMDFEHNNAKVEEDRKLDYMYKTMSDYNYAKEVRINRADRFISHKYKNILDSQLRKLRVYVNKNININIISTVVAVIQSAVMYIYFSYQVFSAQISIADYTVLLGATTLLTSLLLGFFGSVARINKTLNYTELFRKYQSMVAENSNISASNHLEISEIVTDNLTIEFKNVSFTYPGTEHRILDNISFMINHGEKIGIVGLNGSGKTTLIKLLCRLYDPTEGYIYLNGIDIKQIPHNKYTALIGIVLQDFCLFAYSIRENIVFNKNTDEEKLNKCIKKSGLTDKVSALPNGFETVIYKRLDDNGIEFSGGEGQKLALARAIYKNSGILVLDEPTSALDPIAEYELFSKLSDISQGKTALFISHRLSSTRFCDRIFVLSGGKIAESGSHEELMAKQGIYADLFSSQAKYYGSAEV